MMSSDGLRPAANPGRKALGKLATRLEEVKSPWRQVSALELSHNEAARLATDALLEAGEKEYRRVLSEERELNFLSALEIQYITENAARNARPDTIGCNGAERDCAEGDAVSELTSGTYFPMMSDEEPPLLELGWPEVPNRYGPSETQIYFQRDKSQNVKDLIRSLINKAKKVIALVMDIFTDVDIFCDLIEASNKRRVPVYILLDEKNLSYFTDMCTALDIQNSHLNNMRIRSVCGDTYCTKSGKKFTGQVQEKFMIIDCEEVIAGSYSFTWLSAQVHSNMILHFSGRIAESFDREFRCLYADSEIIECFHNPDDEGLPYYTYNVQIPSMDFFQDRGSKERVCSENSSSQSSNSVSSIKAAPGLTPPVYKVLQEKKDTNTLKSPERRVLTNPVLQMSPGNHASRVSPSDTLQSPTAEQAMSGGGHPTAVEWVKAGTPEFLRANLAGPTSKFQAMGLYDTKNFFHGGSKPPPIPQPTMENKHHPKVRSPPNPFFHKFADLFSPPAKEKDSYIFQRSPPQSTHSTAFGGPDLSQNEPESMQGPPPPGPMPKDRMGQEAWINRRDEKRMTLGHSKLDLVNHYNKMKSKQVYSRFELKNNN
ncbi:protein FAM83C [Astyanax mexicanus]|uniref:Family with sequence similarity 83 member C n=1 Tax=Astyanax mexicanus TaxID=7994 RepID=A0A8B9H0K6_ASTMX|nr:protein FAM83C [Astyanax mexicanus]